MSKVDCYHSSGCWEWIASRIRNGYGQFRLNGKMVLAHMVSYELFVGSIPDRMFVCHSCDNPGCVNPDHLWIGTSKDNHQDAKQKGHLPMGDKHGLRLHPDSRSFGNRNGSRLYPEKRVRGVEHHDAKLNPEIVRVFRVRYESGGVSYRELADEYGVTINAVRKAIKGLTWKHVK